MEVDDSDYREDWFVIRNEAHMDFLRMQLAYWCIIVIPGFLPKAW